MRTKLDFNLELRKYHVIGMLFIISCIRPDIRFQLLDIWLAGKPDNRSNIIIKNKEKC
jgi:hypothetical protein